MKRTTLPTHEALWSALVAIDLGNDQPKSFSTLLSDARQELKVAPRHSSPQVKSQYPFRHANTVSGSTQQIVNGLRYGSEGPLHEELKMMDQASKTLGVLREIKTKTEDAISAINAIAHFGLAGAACHRLNAFAKGVASNPFGTAINAWIGILTAGFQAQKAMTFYDLASDHGEFDPDYCTCAPKMGVLDPCQRIANELIKRHESGVVKTAVSVASLGISTLFNPIYKQLKPAPASLADRYFSNTGEMAYHLWKAAQSFGKVVPPKEYDAENALLGIIPGIEVHPQGRGCPKAIATIAALFREFHKGSNYVQTLAVISANDGHSVIKQRIEGKTILEDVKQAAVPELLKYAKKMAGQ